MQGFGVPSVRVGFILTDAGGFGDAEAVQFVEDSLREISKV